LDRYFVADELWSDFESALAHLDIEALIEDASAQLTGYGADDWRDSANHDYQWEIGQVVQAVSIKLRRLFGIWIRSLKIPSPEAVSDKLLKLDANAIFLSFNYTPTLQHLYEIQDSQVLHIHGAASRPDSELVLGHGWRRSVADSLNFRADPESIDFRILEGNRIIDRYFSDTFKPSDKIINQNAHFWKSLGSVSEVFVLGHSLAPVDHPYFQAMCDELRTRNITWTVSYYGSIGDKPAQLAALGVQASAVRYVELSQLR